jgi:hypothetical protein
MRKIVCAMLALVGTIAPAMAADTIAAGIDVFETRNDGNTFLDFTAPADFFCTGSAAGTFHIGFVGTPIVTNPADVLGKTDTVVERLADTTFVNNTATVNAVVRAVSFKSTAPISVSGCAGSSLWDVKVLAGGAQAVFTLTIQRSSPTATGGTFSGSLPVGATLSFTQQGSGARVRATQPVTFTTQSANWTHQPGTGGVTYGSSLQIDTDGDGVANFSVPGTSNFSPGWCPFTLPGCSAQPCPCLIPHQAPQHSHFVFPPPQWCTVTPVSDTAGASSAKLQTSVIQALPCAKKVAVVETTAQPGSE